LALPLIRGRPPSIAESYREPFRYLKRHLPGGYF
jgi:hypothetical protein